MIRVVRAVHVVRADHAVQAIHPLPFRLDHRAVPAVRVSLAANKWSLFVFHQNMAPIGETPNFKPVHLCRAVRADLEDRGHRAALLKGKI